jgi:hypothetical protein
LIDIESAKRNPEFFSAIEPVISKTNVKRENSNGPTGLLGGAVLCVSGLLFSITERRQNKKSENIICLIIGIGTGLCVLFSGK